MCSGVFVVEHVESRQADVRNFFLAESNYGRDILCRRTRSKNALFHFNARKLDDFCVFRDFVRQSNIGSAKSAALLFVGRRA